MKSSARAVGIGVILLLTSMTFWPLARAEDVHVGAVLAALPEGSSRYDKLANLANVSDVSLSNYNQTWIPFFDKYDDLNGVTVTPLTVPAIIQYPATTLRVAQRITFTAEQIMSGASVSWWRSPIGNASATTTVAFQIWRVDSTTNNITSLGVNGPVFQKPSEATLIYNYTGLPWQGPNYIARTFAIPVKPVMAQAQWVDLSSTLEDSHVSQMFPSTNYGTSTALNISQKDSAAQINRAFVKWGNGTIPIGSFIVAANLSMNEFSTGGTNGSQIGAFGITSPWTEAGITYANQPSIQAVSDSNVSTRIPVTRLSWNVTRSFKSGFDTGKNQGVSLRYLNEAPPKDELTKFSSSENATVAQRPSLWVQWAPSAATYNFSYIAVRAPIFSAKNYIAFWQFSGASQKNYHLYYSENDVAQDGIYDSWVKKDALGSTAFIPADLDQSVVFVRGMSNGFGGLVADCSFYQAPCSTTPELTFSFRTSHTIGGPTDPSFLNMIFPVRTNSVTNDPLNPDIQANVVLDFSSGAEGGLFSQGILLKGTNALGFSSWNLTAELGGVYVGRTVKQVNISFTFALNGTKFWLSAKNSAPWSNLTLALSGPPFDQIIPFRFDVYGYFSVDKFYFTNTEKNIVLIPKEEPATALGKLQAFQRWKASIQSKPTTASPLNCQAQLESKAWAYIISAGTKVLTDLINHDQCLTDAILAGLTFILGTIWNVLEPILGTIGNWLFKIGSWLWDALSFVIKAIEWFLFWTVKFLNVFLVGIAFSIIFMASNFVGKAVYEWVKSGYQTDVLKSLLEDGWDRVSDLIKLLVAFATIAIAAIAAVLPL